MCVNTTKMWNYSSIRTQQLLSLHKMREYPMKSDIHVAYIHKYTQIHVHIYVYTYYILCVWIREDTVQMRN